MILAIASEARAVEPAGVGGVAPSLSPPAMTNGGASGPIAATDRAETIFSDRAAQSDCRRRRSHFAARFPAARDRARPARRPSALWRAPPTRSEQAAPPPVPAAIRAAPRAHRPQARSPRRRSANRRDRAEQRPNASPRSFPAEYSKPAGDIVSAIPSARFTASLPAVAASVWPGRGHSSGRCRHRRRGFAPRRRPRARRIPLW